MTHTIIATVCAADDVDNASHFIIPYTGELTKQAVTDAICAQAIAEFSYEDGDCTDQGAYTAGLEDFKIVDFTVIAGSHTALIVR